MLAPVFCDEVVMLVQEDGLGVQCPAIVLSQKRAPYCGRSVNRRAVRIFEWRELVLPQNLKGNKFPADSQAVFISYN